MKTKPFFVLCVLAIFAAVSSCTFFTEPAQEKSSDLVISVGAFSADGARATYSPYFSNPPLSTFAKITLNVTGAGGNFDSNSTGPLTDVWKATLTNVPYGSYTITAKAYINAGDADTAYAAIGTKTYAFSSGAVQTSLTLNVVNNDGTGTFSYKLTDPDTIDPKVTAGLYTFDNSSFSTTLKTALTVDGTVRNIPVDAGYYMLMFGNRVPSIVHIYKDLVTVVDETNDLFNLRVDPGLDSNVNVTLSRSGIVRQGTTVTITMSGQYAPGSISLNGGSDNSSFTGGETASGSGYTRSFTMPSRSVVVSASKGPTPGVNIEFENPSKYEDIDFWSVIAGTPTAAISSAAPGSTITVVGETTVQILYWYLDGVHQASSDFNPNFTIPSPSSAYDVGVVVYMGGVPYALTIPIN